MRGKRQSLDKKNSKKRKYMHDKRCNQTRLGNAISDSYEIQQLADTSWAQSSSQSNTINQMGKRKSNIQARKVFTRGDKNYKYDTGGLELQMVCEDEELSPWQLKANKDATLQYENALKEIKKLKMQNVETVVLDDDAVEPDVIVLDEPATVTPKFKRTSVDAASQPKAKTVTKMLYMPTTTSTNVVPGVSNITAGRTLRTQNNVTVATSIVQGHVLVPHYTQCSPGSSQGQVFYQVNNSNVYQKLQPVLRPTLQLTKLQIPVTAPYVQQHSILVPPKTAPTTTTPSIGLQEMLSGGTYQLVQPPKLSTGVIPGTFGLGVRRPKSPDHSEAKLAVKKPTIITPADYRKPVVRVVFENNESKAKVSVVPTNTLITSKFLEKYCGTKAGDPNYRNETGNFRYKCFMCEMVCFNNNKMMSHLMMHLEQEKHDNLDLIHLTQCKLCYVIHDTPYDLQCHIERVHQNMNPLTCRICEKECVTNNQLEKHMENMHTPGELPYRCQLCNYRSSFYTHVVDHFKNSHNYTGQAMCFYCFKTFKIHSGKPNTAGQCSYYFKHLQKHQTAKSKKCKRCRLVFAFDSEYKAHVHSDHTPEPADTIQVNVSMDQLKGKGKRKKPLPAPVVPNKVILVDVKYTDNLEKSTCKECHRNMATRRHFYKVNECELCRFATCCSNTFNRHQIVFHSKSFGPQLTSHARDRPLQTHYCVCGFESKRGNTMAKHLIKCRKRTCYTSRNFLSTIGKSPVVKNSKPSGASILGVLGLMVKAPELNDDETGGNTIAKIESDATVTENVERALLGGADEGNIESEPITQNMEDDLLADDMDFDIGDISAKITSIVDKLDEESKMAVDEDKDALLKKETELNKNAILSNDDAILLSDVNQDLVPSNKQVESKNTENLVDQPKSASPNLPDNGNTYESAAKKLTSAESSENVVSDEIHVVNEVSNKHDLIPSSSLVAGDKDTNIDIKTNEDDVDEPLLVNKEEETSLVGSNVADVSIENEPSDHTGDEAVPTEIDTQSNTEKTEVREQEDINKAQNEESMAAKDTKWQNDDVMEEDHKNEKPNSESEDVTSTLNSTTCDGTYDMKLASEDTKSSDSNQTERDQTSNNRDKLIQEEENAAENIKEDAIARNIDTNMEAHDTESNPVYSTDVASFQQTTDRPTEEVLSSPTTSDTHVSSVEHNDGTLSQKFSLSTKTPEKPKGAASTSTKESPRKLNKEWDRRDHYGNRDSGRDYDNRDRSYDRKHQRDDRYDNRYEHHHKSSYQREHYRDDGRSYRDQHGQGSYHDRHMDRGSNYSDRGDSGYGNRGNSNYGNRGSGYGDRGRDHYNDNRNRNWDDDRNRRGGYSQQGGYRRY